MKDVSVDLLKQGNKLTLFVKSKILKERRREQIFSGR